MFVHLQLASVFVTLILCIAFDVTYSVAQIIPGLPLPPQHPPQLPDTPPVPGPPTLAPVPLPPQEQERGELPELRVHVKRIETRGNTVFSSMQLHEVTQDYENRSLTTEDIEALRTALTMYYINKGYATSGAIIPDQDLENGLLVVEIIEGRLAGIDVEGNHWFRAGYIRSRVKRGAGPPLNVLQLQEQLQLLQLDQRFTRVTAELQPGLALGQSTLNLKVTEASPFKVRFDVNNYQSPSVGGVQGIVTVEHQNLTGFGDTLSVQYGRSRGVNPLLNLRYTLPLHPSNTTLSLQYRRSAFAVIEEPFKALNIENKAEIFSVGLRQPVYRSVQHELALSLAGDYEQNESFLLGEPVEFVAGATNGVFKIAAGRFGQDYTYRAARHMVFLTSRFSVGIGDVLNSSSSSNVPGSADGRFFAWLGEAQYLRQFDLWRTQLVARAMAQLTPDHLFPLEQMAVGGRYSVRGYREFSLVRDNATLASLEARVPIYTTTSGFDTLLATFIDYGRAWNSQVPTPDPTTLASIGGGLIWHIPWKESRFEVYWGKQLNKLEFGDSNLQDHGVHLQLVIQAL